MPEDEFEVHETGRESVDIDDLLNSPPYYLLARRTVRHKYAEVNCGYNPPASRLINSLGFQMRASIQDLVTELREQGRDYDLLLQGGFEGEHGRWSLLLNGEHFVTIDRDYGYDCFDASSTQFKEKIAGLIDEAEQKSKIRPLNEQEREELNARLASDSEEWGRLHPDEKHAVGLGREYLKQRIHNSQGMNTPNTERTELRRFMKKYFKSSRIKERLEQQEIDAWTQALLVLTVDAPLHGKRGTYLRLIEEETRVSKALRKQLEPLYPGERLPSDEQEKILQKLRACEDAITVFSTFLMLVESAMYDLLFWLNPPSEETQEHRRDDADRHADQRCVLFTSYKHDEDWGFDESSGLGLGVQFQKIGRLRLTSGMDVSKNSPCGKKSFRPSVILSNRDKLTFAQYKPLNAESLFFANDTNEIGGLLGYSGRQAEPSFIVSNRLYDTVFGVDEKHLKRLQSQFVGIFEPGTILTLDFEPFYKKREGIVLKPAYTDEFGGEDHVVSEMVLTKVGSRWACGTLAGRYFFGGCDPLGFFFNSYSAVNESGIHNVGYDMVALEALIGTFLDEAENGFAAEGDECLWTREASAEEAEFYMLEAIQVKMKEDPALADRIVRAFDWSPRFGLSDEELLEICELDVWGDEHEGVAGLNSEGYEDADE